MLINLSLKCLCCKKTTNSLEVDTITSLEFECDHCGEWSYWEKPKEAKKQVTKVTKKKETKAPAFSKGMKVRKNIYFQGKANKGTEVKIHSISKGVIYLCDSEGRKETGVTYHLDGNEVENIFPGFTSKIKLIKAKK